MNRNQTRAASRFPAAIYRETVLEPVFAEAKRMLLQPLIEVEGAHTLMLARQGILPVKEAAQCLRALAGLDLDAIHHTPYDGSFEDLFFLLEQRMAAACGADVAGKMHTARSRNDLDLTMYRMLLRARLLAAHRNATELRRCLIELASEHRAALMPAYTHGQPAQPTTLGHYLMAYIEVLERDGERLRAAYGRVNRSPLGACAITTTGFPIDREWTSEMLGFEGLQVNSYGAIAAVDYVAESCSVLATAMLSLGRFTQDLLLWSSAEFGYLRLSDGFVQISSIMPQKRNPVPLEHVRMLASRALTQAQGVLGCLHNTPFADMNDAEDQLQPLVAIAFADADRALRLLAGLLGEAEFQAGRMASAAEGSFLTVTELADTLVREAGLPFAAAHALVSAAVRVVASRGAGYDAEALAGVIEQELPRLTGRPDAIRPDQIRTALRARNFVEVRDVPGGPAERALRPELERARAQLRADEAWSESAAARLEKAHAGLHRAVRELTGDADAALASLRKPESLG